jgi:hypothetical protein
MNIIKQKGSSTVEFAMIVPILLLLVFMVSELSTMFYQLNTLTKSVQVATRYLSDVSTDPTLALDDDKIKNLICYGNSGGSGTDILPDCVSKLDLAPPPSPASNHVTVSASYPANWIGFLYPSSDSLTLKASSVMRFAQ